MAHRPETGPVRAAKESKRLMQGKRGFLFSLYLSFIFWYLLEMIVTSTCEGMLGSIPALMVQLLISLALTVYLRGSLTAFYLSLPEIAQPEGTPETESLEDTLQPGDLD